MPARSCAGADVVGNNDGLLEVGETWTYTAAHTVTQAEIDSNGGGDGDLDNTATADSDQTGPDTDDATVPVGQNPALNIVKTAAGRRPTVADTRRRARSPTRSRCTNTGNVTLTGVTVTRPARRRRLDRVGHDRRHQQRRPAGRRRDLDLHAPTRSPRPSIDSNGGGDGDLDNTATADSDQTGPDTDDATVPVDQNPALNIVKTASVDADDRTRPLVDTAGDVINYAITVHEHRQRDADRRDGDDPIDRTGSRRRCDAGDTNNDDLLESVETWTYTASHTVTQAEIDSNGGGDGDIDNTCDGRQQRDRPGHRRRAGRRVVGTRRMNIVKIVQHRRTATATAGRRASAT